MNSVPTDPMIGQTLDGRYVVRSRIARGGMAMVYLANDLRLERKVAVKVMHAHLAEDENFTRRFEQEARSAAGLSHPNLVGVFDQGHDIGRTYLVMEYLPSITLRELLKQQRRLTTEQTFEISNAVLSGLAAAHSSGIVHRDLKPENVLLADDGRIKLGDFGLARAVSANTTTGQALLGTIAYLSPELVTRGVADARSDLYAFGIMLYEMLTGEQPFTGEQPMQIAYQHAHSDVPLPSLKTPEITAEIDELVRWTTQRDPELRPRDAAAALEYLSTVRQGGDTAALTRALPPLDDTTVLATPSTTVLPPEQQHEFATAAPEPRHEPVTPDSHTDRAATSARARSSRGRIIAAAVVVAVCVAAGLGWWFGHGPGSLATVPEVTASAMPEATALIETHHLVAEVFECSSLEVPAGQAARTEPEAGTRLERGSIVRLCQSTGPEMLAVPTLVGLNADDAKQTLRDAGFTFGEVTEERFDGTAANTVIAALAEDGTGLGETYPERGRIDLIVSSGPIPDVAGLTQDEATAQLRAVGLTVDAALTEDQHSDDIEEGDVIALITTGEALRPGEAVGLRLSLGPELFTIPEVSGMPLQDAMNALSGAGFAPSTLVPDALRSLARATETVPAAGEQVALGTEIRVKSELSL